MTSSDVYEVSDGLFVFQELQEQFFLLAEELQLLLTLGFLTLHSFYMHKNNYNLLEKGKY